MVTQATKLAVKAEAVVKSFGETAVLRGLNVELPTGEVTVLLGTNGAGKSTFLRILAMLTKCDSGDISMLGNDIAKHGPTVRSLTGSMLHSPMLYRDMSVQENLLFFADLYRLKNIEELITTITAKVGIEPWLDHRLRTLSHGFQKRVALARALIHAPQLLILDEPESGLDSRSVARLDRIIDEYRSQGRTVIMTTHIVEHALEIADRAIVLNNGTVCLTSTNPTGDKAEIIAAYSSPDESDESGY